MKSRIIKIRIPEYCSNVVASELQKLVEDRLLELQATMPHSTKIIGEVLKYFNTTLVRIRRNTKRDEILYPRQILTYFLYKYSSATASEIGVIVGKKSKMTIYSTIYTIEGMMYLTKVKKDIESIKQLLNLTKDEENTNI